MTKEEIIRMARLYGTPVQEQNAEIEYRFTLEQLGLLLSTNTTLGREACAKVAEAYEPRCDTCPSGVANAIRAMGNT